MFTLKCQQKNLKNIYLISIIFFFLSYLKMFISKRCDSFFCCYLFRHVQSSVFPELPFYLLNPMFILSFKNKTSLHFFLFYFSLNCKKERKILLKYTWLMYIQRCNYLNVVFVLSSLRERLFDSAPPHRLGLKK